MEEILNNVLEMINDAMGYLRLFVIGGTAFFVAKDFALKWLVLMIIKKHLMIEK